MGNSAAFDTNQAESEIETIAATARVILKLCEGQDDVRTRVERIVYAAAVIQHQGGRYMEQINFSEHAERGANEREAHHV
ncbi:hypothetical protein [Burkholderia cepacia]|uniref:hypothetical protein n=1 Tax=Burkholderia cepacia TaxID=292 RepID=UPI000F59EE13|nr:hypothetical protein [Burkholderia cepacia]